MDLIWVEGSGLLVAGPDTRAHVADVPPGGGGYVGLRLSPGTAPAVLGCPAHELRDQRVALDALWPSSTVRHLVESMADVDDKGAALESIAVDRLGQNGHPDPVLRQIAAALKAQHSVANVADAMALSERQLRRRCLDAFGYGPKTFSRILRMDQALHLARRRTPLAEVAAHAGYADQAHLAREVKALAGISLTRLILG